MKIELRGISKNHKAVLIAIDGIEHQLRWEAPIELKKDKIMLELWAHDERHPAELVKIFIGEDKEDCKKQFLIWYWQNYGMMLKTFDEAMAAYVRSWKSYKFVVVD